MARIFEINKCYMKTITIYGVAYDQFASNIAYTLRKYKDYRLFELNKGCNNTCGEEYYNQSKETFEKIYNLPQYKFPIIGNLLKGLYALIRIVLLARKSDLVQFHYISPFVLLLVFFVKCFSISKISAFIYGSDFLRAGQIQLWLLGKVFSLSDSIVCTSSSVLDKLKHKYPESSSKMYCCYLGSSVVDKLLTVDNFESPLILGQEGKKIIMCGYNRSEAQQHIKILESLKNVAKDFFWIFPMTYGEANYDYIEKVKAFADKLKIDYIILKNYLPEDEWVKYVISTDVFIHMQVSDAFSASISQHLILGHLVINGSWLEYKDLDVYDVFYLSTDFDHLESLLTNAFVNYEKIENKLKANKEKMMNITGLNNCILKYWIPYFENLLSIT